MSNEEYTHQDFWKQRTWMEQMEQHVLRSEITFARKAMTHYIVNPPNQGFLFWYDHKGRKIIGKAPDRTCLTCFTGFGLETMDKHGLSPCCNTHNHAAVLWE